MGFVTPISVILALVAPPRRVPLLQTLARRVLSLVGRLTRPLLPLRVAAGGRGGPFSSFSLVVGASQARAPLSASGSLFRLKSRMGPSLT